MTTSSAFQRAGSTHTVAAMIGAIGSALGVLAGFAEFSVGSSILPWIGNKNDPVRLGIVTMLLATVALLSALALDAQPRTATNATRRAALTTGMLVPALVCATTVGRLWYVPGALLVAGAAISFRDLRTYAGAILVDIERNAPRLLTALLAAMYAGLGFTALGPAGWSGIGGGVIVLTLLAGPRRHRAVAAVVLTVAVAPFAVATWWSVVTPTIALLVVVIGTNAVTARRRDCTVGTAGGQPQDAPARHAPIDHRAAGARQIGGAR